ncbi:MAG: DUF3108 domain-containing protein [Planctomycetota bacterium]
MKAVRIRREALPDHPWIYRKQIAKADAGTRNGDPVRILTKDGTSSGAGLFHGRSRIALRVLTRDPDIEIDREFLARRIEAAVRLRRDVLRLDERTDAWRVVNSEGDGLSGLIVDRYGGSLAVQVKCLAFFRLAPDVADILREHFPGARIVYRRDAQAERIEGFRVPEPEGDESSEIASDGIRMRVDLARGHKTGSFLDQRDNRVLAASISAGREVLDLFCYEGGFALACARAGASGVRGADLDEEAVARARDNARLNGLDVEFTHGDAFEVLRARPRADLLLLDPPRWISSREEEEAGKRRYLDLNALAVEALPADGLLLTSSCSGRLSAAAFLEILRRAAARAGRSVSILEVRGAAPDHPENGPPMRAAPLILLLLASCAQFDPIPPDDVRDPAPIEPARPALPAEERLSYRGTWNGVSSGGAEFHFRREGDEYLSEGTLETRGLVSLLYGVNAKAAAASGAEDLLSRRWSYDAEDAEKPKRVRTRFDPTSGRVLSIVRKGEEVKRVIHEVAGALDPFGMIYFLRRARLAPGTSFRAHLISEWHLYRLDGRVMGRERIQVPAGAFDTIFVRADLTKLVDGVPEEKSRGLGLWLVDDARRVPVRIDADTKYGRVSLTLTNTESY